MSTLKPLTASQIQGALKATRYPKNLVSSDFIHSLTQLTVDQINDGKKKDYIADYLGMAIANRLPKGYDSIDFAHDVKRRFLKSNGAVEV